MKHFLLFFITFSLAPLVAQKSVHLTIAGISAEAEKATIPGDRVGYYKFDKGDGYSKNIIVAATTEKGKKRFFESFDIQPDASGHYDFSKIIMIEEGSKFTFDGNIELLIYMPTIFGNAYWTQITRTADNIGDPIVLDRYTEREGRDFEPRKRLSISFASIAYDNDLKNAVKENGDSWEDRERSDFKLMLKNEGDSEWKINEVVQSGSLTNGRQVEAKIEYKDQLDLNKPIVIRGEVTTQKGHILWHEETVEARALAKVFFASQYLILEQSQAEATSQSNNEEVEEAAEVEDLIEEEEEEEVVDVQVIAQAVKNNTTKKQEPDSADPKSGPGYGIALDLTTPTVIAACPNKQAGDTLVRVNGSEICIHESKPVGKRIKGKLAMDVNILVDGIVFPIRGQQPIEIRTADASLEEAFLRAEVIYTNQAGTFVLKSGSKVVFQNEKLVGASLAQDAVVSFEGKNVVCAPNPMLEQDIRFDTQGKLVECTIADPLTWGSTIVFNFPKGSRLVFRSGSLSKVFTSTPSSFSVNGITYYVLGDPKVDAYEFSKEGILEEIKAGEGNTVSVEGKSIPVEVGSKMKFEMIDGQYYLERFFVDQEVTVNVYKKGKVKEETIKKGDKIIFEKGVVVKAG